MKQRVYIDTSIVGGYFDEEFKEATLQLFQQLENNELQFIVSDLLDLELINAPEKVRNLLLKYSPENFRE
jgi:predicted nucleic acid-binding protein